MKKEDQRRKDINSVGGHAINYSYPQSYSSVVQSMSVPILLTITESYDLKVMGGDAGSTFPHARPLEKCMQSLRKGLVR